MIKKNGPLRRDSASVILVARNGRNDDYDYQVLLLKRSDKTALVANQSVFPGGVFESADESIAWLKYLNDFGVQERQLEQFFLLKVDRPRLLEPQRKVGNDCFLESSHIWARDLSLRITALRETFEETGVLLCRNKSQLTSNESCYKDDFNIKYWQEIVHNNASKFLCMCQELQVIPDFWALHEWSIWASPAVVMKGFETVFFITFLPEQPKLFAEEMEVKECMWLTPFTSMEMFRSEQLWFLPPQVYELSRLCGVKSFNALHTFAKQRSSKGTTLFLPVGYVCLDGIVAVLPGDDFYLADPRSVTDYIKTDLTVAEFRKKSKRIHRCEFPGMPFTAIHLNFEPSHGHLPPICDTFKVSQL